MLKSVILLSLMAYVLAEESPMDGNHRIIGGKPTHIENYPWQVSLQLDGAHFCGGSLLSERFVLTAAHCLTDFPPNVVTVRVGATNFKHGGQLYKVLTAKRHKDYDPATMENDIAVLYLANEVSFGRAAKAIKLAEQAPPTGTRAAVTGWGTTSIVSGALSENLQAAIVRMVSQESCSSTNYDYGPSIKSGMICAQIPGKDSCQGDSGGPLVSSNGQLVGVVSWGRGCGDAKLPGVYADVAYYNKWILEAIDELQNNND